jgi:hypothetical protein
MAIARGLPAAAAPMREDDDPASVARDQGASLEGRIARQERDSPLRRSHSHGASAASDRARSSRTSSSEVGAKSSHQKPMAAKGSGVSGQTTSSNSARTFSQASAAANTDSSRARSSASRTAVYRGATWPSSTPRADHAVPERPDRHLLCSPGSPSQRRTTLLEPLLSTASHQPDSSPDEAPASVYARC